MVSISAQYRGSSRGFDPLKRTRLALLSNELERQKINEQTGGANNMLQHWETMGWEEEIIILTKGSNF